MRGTAVAQERIPIRRTMQDVDGKIREMVRRIVERFHPQKIILFGSHATGTAGPDSDVDLLVVMDVDGSRRKRAVEIDLALADVDVPKDVIVVTPEDLQAGRESVGTIIHPAVREGATLYESRQ